MFQSVKNYPRKVSTDSVKNYTSHDIWIIDRQYVKYNRWKKHYELKRGVDLKEATKCIIPMELGTPLYANEDCDIDVVDNSMGFPIADCVYKKCENVNFLREFQTVDVAIVSRTYLNAILAVGFDPNYADRLYCVGPKVYDYKGKKIGTLFIAHALRYYDSNFYLMHPEFSSYSKMVAYQSRFPSMWRR